MGPQFDAAELDAAYRHFQEVVDEVAQSKDWDRWADQFTTDAHYVEHAYGTFHGREEIRAWIAKTMTAFPGSHMVAYPALWHVCDAATGRVIAEVDNPMRDPGDGAVFTVTNISILTYAGDGQWSAAEDVYNPMEFGAMTYQWCQRAAACGTLDAPAQAWLETYGPAFAPRRKPTET